MADGLPETPSVVVNHILVLYKEGYVIFAYRILIDRSRLEKIDPDLERGYLSYIVKTNPVEY
jgi:hypothetical protein